MTIKQFKKTLISCKTPEFYQYTNITQTKTLESWLLFYVIQVVQYLKYVHQLT